MKRKLLILSIFGATISTIKTVFVIPICCANSCMTNSQEIRSHHRIEFLK